MLVPLEAILLVGGKVPQLKRINIRYIKYNITLDYYY